MISFLQVYDGGRLNSISCDMPTDRLPCCRVVHVEGSRIVSCLFWNAWWLTGYLVVGGLLCGFNKVKSEPQ